MIRLRSFHALSAALVLAAAGGVLHATQTENNVMRILPAPGPVVIDGQTADWDLSGGLFACDDVERFRDMFSTWLFAMHDRENLYLLINWKDATPLNNDQSGKGGHGFQGDCLQVRFIFDYRTPDEKVSHWMGWRDRDNIELLTVAYGRDIKESPLGNTLDHGARQAFRVADDGEGYTQEIAIPWKLLTTSGQPPAAGAAIRMALEPNFTAGPIGRINIHDIFLEGVLPDRIFTFRAYEQWGVGVLEAAGRVAPAPVRLSDERQFPFSLAANGRPSIDWTGLIRKQELPGFKTIPFDAPQDGLVSLNIRDAKGGVVRQLLTENFFSKGSNQVKWDGLTTPHYKKPGEPVPPGTYDWEAIIHPPFKLTLRGWAGTSGSAPWENGPTTHWGGDHHGPAAAAADGEKIYLGWGMAEAGKGIIACDPEGNVVWKVGTGLGNSSQLLAVEDGILFNLGRVGFENVARREIARLRTTDGVFDNWQGRSSAALTISDLWAGLPNQKHLPQAADGMDVRDGKLYLTFSSQTFHAASIIDWKAFAAALTDGKPLHSRVLALIDRRASQHLDNFLKGKITERQLMQNRPFFAVETLKALNDLLPAADLAPGAARLSPAARAEANRKFLETQFPAAIAPLETNFIAICDARSGKLLKTLPAPYPQSLRALGGDRLLFASDGASIHALNTASGAMNPLVTGLRDITAITTDAGGNIYAAVDGDQRQVKTFAPDGRATGAIGRPGGRRPLGKWQPDGLLAPSALAIDNARRRLWVAEEDSYPKRFSVWNLADSTLAKEFFGATHYGASGGAINPLDPNIMAGTGCEWRLDPATGRAVCTGVFERTINGFAAFCPAPNGRLYLATLFEVMHNRCGLRIFERLGEGDYKLRAEWRPDYSAQTTTVWSDADGDGEQDPDEVTVFPYTIQLHGSNCWSININRNDLTLFAAIITEGMARSTASESMRVPQGEIKLTQTIFSKVRRINLAGFTACGAPKWDLAHMEDLDYVWSQALAAGSHGMVPSDDNRLLLAIERDWFRCYDLVAKKEIWSYPNPFFQVHGSHLAPPPVPGVTRGAYGAIGTFRTPALGTTWVINGNTGEWYMLTEKGYYLGHLFQGDLMKMRFPDKAIPGADMTESPPGLGGEDFGGSITQAPDGAVYLQAGKTGLWNVLLTGIDQVTTIPGGKITIAPDEIALAQREQEAQRQVAEGTKIANIKRLTPAFTGDIRRDFTGVPPLAFQKSEQTAVNVTTAWDGRNLYLGWAVTDNTPWVNGATDPAQLYLSGDTVDFQFGSDPKADSRRNDPVAGDLRLSIGNFRGEPAAVLYRAISSEKTGKKPRSFASGVIAHYQLDYVDTLPDARIKVTVRPDKKGYTVEAAIPWASLKFTPEPGLKYTGDAGVTYGDEAGARTRLRVYWSNQETGLVDDAVFELKMVPRNWGRLIFQP
jgi:hypothetical protein